MTRRRNLERRITALEQILDAEEKRFDSMTDIEKARRVAFALHKAERNPQNVEQFEWARKTREMLRAARARAKQAPPEKP
jgi:hypothetical protein